MTTHLEQYYNEQYQNHVKDYNSKDAATITGMTIHSRYHHETPQL